jgi:hypothetical protein
MWSGGVHRRFRGRKLLTSSGFKSKESKRSVMLASGQHDPPKFRQTSDIQLGVTSRETALVMVIVMRTVYIILISFL